MHRSVRGSLGDDVGKCATQMESGRGQYLFDDAGAKYLDCVNAAAQVGHCADAVVAATGEALERLSDDWGTVSEGPAELERLLSQTLPPNLNCFLFCDSGSEAVDLAVQLARLWHCSSSRLPASARRKQTDSKSRKGSSRHKKKSAKEASEANNSQGDGMLTTDITYQPYKARDREINPCEQGPPAISSKYSGETFGTNVPHPTSSSYFNGSYSKSDDGGHQLLPCPPKMGASKEAFDNPTASTSAYEADDYRTNRDRSSRVHSSYTSCDSDFSNVSSGFANDSGFYSSGVSGGSSAADASSAVCLVGDIVVVDGSYHGCTESVMNLSSRMASSSVTDSTPRVVVIPVPDLDRAPGLNTVTSGSDEKLDEKAVAYYLKTTKKVLQDALKDGAKIAGFLCEPLLTIQGVQQPPASWLQGVYRLMREHCGALCISDETQCGLGRLGDDMWGFQTLGVEPDIVVAGKGLGNGFPMAVTITTQEIASKLGHMRESYRCSGVQSAVGSAVLDSLKRDQLLQGTSDTGRHLTKLLKMLKKKHSCVGAVRGRGLLHAVELVWSKRGGAPASAIAEFLVVKLRRVGVVIAREGVHRNVLLIMPPLTFTELDSVTLVAKLDEALALVPHNFTEESTEEKVKLRFPPELSIDPGYPPPGPSGTADPLLPRQQDNLFKSDVDDVTAVTDAYQASTSSGYSSVGSQRPSSPEVLVSDPFEYYPMRGEPIHPSSHSRISSTADTNYAQSMSRTRDSQNFPSSSSLSGLQCPGSRKTTQNDHHRQIGSTSHSYPYSQGYQQNSSSSYDGSSFANSASSEVYDESPTRRSPSNAGSSVAGYSGASHSLASPERNSTSVHSSKSKLSKNSSANKKGKPDIFSNIDFEVRDSVPPVADVLSGVSGIMQSGSTFVNPPVGGRGNRSSRAGSSSKSAVNRVVHSTPSSRPSTSRECVASPTKNESLHPDENPRGCYVTNVGLGMMAPLPVKTSPLRAPRLDDYEDFDD